MTAPVGTPPTAPVPGSTVTRRRPGWPLFLVVVFVVIMLGVLAIIFLRDDRSDTPDASAALQRERQAVIDAELAFFRVIREANDPPNPAHPGLSAYATDQALANAVKAAEDSREKGIAFRLPPNSRSEHRPEVVSIDESKAVVHDCAIDDGQLIEIATGRVVDAAVETVLYEVTLVRANKSSPWKVSLSKFQQRWDGIGGCAV